MLFGIKIHITHVHTHAHTIPGTYNIPDKQSEKYLMAKSRSTFFFSLLLVSSIHIPLCLHYSKMFQASLTMMEIKNDFQGEWKREKKCGKTKQSTIGVSNVINTKIWLEKSIFCVCINQN